MRHFVLISAVLLASCASRTAYFVDDVGYGWRCEGERTFVAIERGGDNSVLIIVGGNRYLLPYAAQDRSDDEHTNRYGRDGIQYEINYRLAAVDRLSASLNGTPEGEFRECRLDPTVTE